VKLLPVVEMRLSDVQGNSTTKGEGLASGISGGKKGCNPARCDLVTGIGDSDDRGLNLSNITTHYAVYLKLIQRYNDKNEAKLDLKNCPVVMQCITTRSCLRSKTCPLSG